MFCNQVVQGTNDIFIHQRHDRRVGNNGGRVFGWIARKAGDVDLLVVGREVLGNFHGVRGTFFGA